MITDQNNNSEEITEITKDVQKSIDHSLQNQAFERALSGARPKTMTAHEWEEWLALQEQSTDQPDKG